jgi:hypothetical protein
VGDQVGAAPMSYVVHSIVPTSPALHRTYQAYFRGLIWTKHLRLHRGNDEQTSSFHEALVDSAFWW